jgi:hypothetical protein
MEFSWFSWPVHSTPKKTKMYQAMVYIIRKHAAIQHTDHLYDYIGEVPNSFTDDVEVGYKSVVNYVNR